jgi:hypothetical protein
VLYGSSYGGSNDAGLQFTAGTSNSMTFNAAGNLGLGVTPSAWSLGKAIEIGATGSAIWNVDIYNLAFTQNAYFNTSWKYARTQAASFYDQYTGAHRWFNAPAGNAGDTISFTQAMTLDASGNLGVGTTSPSARFDLTSSAQLLANFNSTNASAGYIQFQSSGTLYGFVGSAATLSSGSSTDFTIRSQNNLLFTSGGGSERARIDSSGNLLVGGTSNAANARVMSENASGNQLGFRYSSVATYYWGVDSSGNATLNQDGTERLRIASGNFLVGTTGDIANGGFAFNPLTTSSGNSYQTIGHKSGTASGDYFIGFYYAGGPIGSITQNGTTATAYNTSSDYRLKNTIAQGLASAPEAFMGLLKGHNFGKQVVKLI